MLAYSEVTWANQILIPSIWLWHQASDLFLMWKSVHVRRPMWLPEWKLIEIVVLPGWMLDVSDIPRGEIKD